MKTNRKFATSSDILVTNATVLVTDLSPVDGHETSPNLMIMNTDCWYAITVCKNHDHYGLFLYSELPQYFRNM